MKYDYPARIHALEYLINQKTQAFRKKVTQLSPVAETVPLLRLALSTPKKKRKNTRLPPSAGTAGTVCPALPCPADIVVAVSPEHLPRGKNVHYQQKRMNRIPALACQ